MALIKCPECKKKMSDKARSCPHCGYIITLFDISKTKSESKTQKIVGTIIIGILIIIVINKCSKSDIEQIPINYKKTVTKYVTTNLNVREAPDTESDVIKVLKPNEVVNTFDTLINGFTVILDPDKTIFGWSSNKYLQTSPLSQNQLEEIKIKKIVDQEKRKNEWKDKDERIKAWLLTKDIVEGSLKSPATAEFPYYNSSFVYKGTTTLDYVYYTVRAYVDSQNGFGALIRTNFIVKLKQTSTDDWDLVDIKFNE